MSQYEHNNTQPLRELSLLAHYFKEHGRDDVAQEIVDQVSEIRQRSRLSAQDDGSKIVQFHRHAPEEKEA